MRYRRGEGRGWHEVSGVNHPSFFQFTPQRRIDPLTVISHRLHDVRDLRCVSIEDSLDQTGAWVLADSR